MCGIVGMISTERTAGEMDRRKWFKDAMVVSALRGTDSAGMFMIPMDDKDDAIVQKKAIPPWDFVESQLYGQALWKLDRYSFTVGHTRSATIGKVTAAAAHPFVFGDTYFVHNGTLTNWRNFVDPTKFESDSEALAWMVSEMGPEEAFKKVRGAFACVWVNRVEKRLYMVRNDERPLHFATAHKEKSVFFASEQGMLSWVLNRYNIEAKIYKLGVGHMIWFDQNSEDIRKFQGKKVEFAPPLPEPAPWPKWGENGYAPSANNAPRHGNLVPYRDTLKEAREMYKQGTEVRFFPAASSRDAQSKGRWHVMGYTVDGAYTQVRVTTNLKNPLNDKVVYTGKVKGHIKSQDGVAILVNKVRATNIKVEDALPTEDADNEVQDKVIGPDDTLIDANEWLKLTRYGCDFCHVNLQIENAEDIVWDAKGRPFCQNCIQAFTGA